MGIERLTNSSISGFQLKSPRQGQTFVAQASQNQSQFISQPAPTAVSNSFPLPFAKGAAQNDVSLNYMRALATRLLQAMDNPNHPCNPLRTASASITKVQVIPVNDDITLYTMWISDGETTCGLEMQHSSGQTKQLLTGDFITRFYVDAFRNAFNYTPEVIQEVAKPNKKHFDKAQIGQAARDLVAATMSEDFFQNTEPGPYSGFHVSEGYNVIQTSGASLFTPNVVRVNLRRLDMPQARPTDQTAQNKVELHVQAETPDSTNAFRVVTIDFNNSGVKPGAVGGVAKPSLIQNWMNYRKNMKPLIYNTNANPNSLGVKTNNPTK